MSQSWASRALHMSTRNSLQQRPALRRGTPPTVRPGLEILEDRTLPSITFTNFSVPSTTTSSGQLTLNGTIHDTNSPTSVSVSINWGDKSSTTVSASATATPGTFVFSAAHPYPNPPSASNPVFTITATAKDSTKESIRATEAALAVDGLKRKRSHHRGVGQQEFSPSDGRDIYRLLQPSGRWRTDSRIWRSFGQCCGCHRPQ